MAIRLDPLRELDRMAQSLGQLFARPGPVQVSRADDEVRLEIDLPGVKADDIELTVDAERVVVRAVRRSAEERAEGSGAPATELGREWAVREPIDVERVNASYEDGVLTVRLPRSGGSRPRRVPVRHGSERPAGPSPGSPGDPVGGPSGPSAPSARSGGDAPSPGTAPETAPPPLGEQANPLPTS